MPYVRKHGNQVAIVHGARDPETRKVEQRVLFTLYSKPEAEAALGRRETDPPLSFERLVEARHENVRFDWRKIAEGIDSRLGELPDHYEYPISGVAPALRQGIVAFARGLLHADPQGRASTARAVQEQREELMFLRRLIDWRLSLCDNQKEHRFNRDNEFGWLSRESGDGAPPEALELLDSAWSREEEDHAAAVTRLYLEIWPSYADGHNQLGNLALERGDHDAALAAYADALRVGRKLFPKRVAKSRWWTDLDTRPYMRAMRNTTMALLRSGRSEEALQWCERLENEVHDVDSAGVFGAAACLNLGRWSEARDLAGRYVSIWPEENFVAALAAFELGELDDALARWLHAAIQKPRAARMLVGIPRESDPEGMDQVRDHNTGVDLSRTLSTYLDQGEDALALFTDVMESAEVATLIQEHDAVRQAQRENRSDDRTAYRRLMEMQTPEFARARASELAHLLGAEP